MSMKESIHEILTSVGESFSHMIDMALANEIQEGAVVALFKICRQDCFRCLCAHALRTLASICCVEEGISQLEKYEKALLEKCMELTIITERCIHTEDEYFLMSMKESIHEILTSVGESFSHMIDMALANEIQVLVRQIELSDNMYTIGTAISSLLGLTQEGAHLCRIIAKEGAVVALFKICRQDCFRCLCAHALRTLASICCVEEGISQLEKEGAVVALFKICRQDCFRCLCAHALRTLASICCVEEGISQLEKNMEDIVTALIKLCQHASSGEVFLLASAALANITFFDTMASEILLQLSAVRILFEACRDRKRVDTPYSKDQVVTVLANISVLDHCASEVIQERGIECLLEMLFEKPSTSNPPEVAACERVQQKAAVTLARLSRDPVVAHTATKLNCIPRLIELCRSPTERSNSDSVLVACLFNVDLNGSTADLRAPYQPQGLLVRGEPWSALPT
ncbi:UNVERIFIED_CONTAM: hypothetical protein FKN15_025952 [Acipenser sinensis]